MTITSLGYIGFNVSDMGAWQKFATEFLGLMPGVCTGDLYKYRSDHRAWRFATQKGDQDDIAFVGFEAPTQAAYEDFKTTLKSRDILFSQGSPSLLEQREVQDLIVLKDPAGLQVEVFVGQTERFEHPFHSPAGVSGFLAGDQGAGHIVLASEKADEVRAFYKDIIGMRLSDTIGMELGPDFTLLLEFYHCNPRHHTLALTPIAAPKRLHHFMLETQSLDDVGFALDRVKACGVQQTTTLGKHSNDHMVSFYSKTPSGFEVEFGWGGRPVDDETWHVAHHTVTSVWGHRPIS